MDRTGYLKWRTDLAKLHAQLLAEIMIEALAPIRRKREEIDRDPSIVWDVLAAGNAKARERAAETMELVRKAIKFAYPELRR